MPRVARNQLPPEGIYHVTARGVAGLPLYIDDVDRLDFMSLLGTVRRAAPFRIHAYCLMTTHYHLVAESRLPDLSSALHALNGRYAMPFNRRHERHGHLFESRYSAWVCVTTRITRRRVATFSTTRCAQVSARPRIPGRGPG